jgi:hypothetical protein
MIDKRQAMSEQTTAEDIVTEAQRLLAAARSQDVAIRLLGGVAVRLTIAPGEQPVLARAYQDIDLIIAKGAGRGVGQFLEAEGYAADRAFNATNGHRRLLFYDEPRNRQVDVFVGAFAMCHTIPLSDRRLTLLPDSIPLAELLLTKLQIVELNPKDLGDIITLVYHHDVGDSDTIGSGGSAGVSPWQINAARAAELCALDWGLWRTVRMNIERTTAALPETALSRSQQDLVADRIDRLWQRIQDQPKSAKWKLRHRVGDRMVWYEQPEEVG